MPLIYCIFSTMRTKKKIGAFFAKFILDNNPTNVLSF